MLTRFVFAGVATGWKENSVARPVDILYLGVLTAEHFPLQLELPDTGATCQL